MTRFQKLSLLIGALVLVLMIAIIGVLLTRPSVVIPSTSALSSSDQTNTWAVEWAATNRATIDAIATSAWETVNAPSSP